VRWGSRLKISGQTSGSPLGKPVVYDNPNMRGNGIDWDIPYYICDFVKSNKRSKFMKHLLVARNSCKVGSLYIISVIFLLNLAACAGVPISYYDATTYTQLTSLKAEATTLVESFDTKPFTENQKKIEDTTLNFKKAYEYEKGKGDPNSDTTKQFEKIYGLFIEDVNDYRENKQGELGENYFKEAAEVLGQAFDIAISTENLKNKDKR
jgi:hypothetical protein